MAAKVKAYEEQIAVPTYTVGAAAKNPGILIEGHTNIYPYSLMDNINQGKEDRLYRSLTLENEYLRVRIFPEMGGHIWSAYDKVSGEEMFLKNEVFKPGLILLRGSWCAYGLEFNFPCGHTVTTMQPVDNYLRSNPDGSASVFVGDVEMVSRMKWLVEIQLRPGESAIRTNIRLMNGTDVARRYYFWSNAGVPADDGFQFITPANESNVGGVLKPFPMQNGVDKSWYKNHDHAGDVFTVNSREDYFGYYDHNRDFGVAHVAPWYKVRGKKFFTWGTGDDGLIWADILSDNAKPYVEIQSGPFPTQSDFGMLQPHTANCWEALWYPVRGTGAFTFADDIAAVRIDVKPKQKDSKTVTCAINVNRNLRNARVRIRVEEKDGFKTAYSEKTDLSIRKTFTASFTATIGTRPLELKIIDSKGVHLLTCLHRQRREQPAVPESEEVTGGTFGQSLESVFNSGFHFERYNNVSKALEKYREAIEKDPLFSLPLVEMGKIQIYMGLYKEAAANLEKSLQRAPWSSDARYYYGVALKLLGRLDDAIGEFQQLSIDNRISGLGYYELGQIEMMKSNFIDASHLFAEALRLNPDDIFTEIMVPVSWRKRGRKSGPMKLLKAVREKDPTCFMPLYEMLLLSQSTKGLKADAAADEMNKVMRDNPQSYIELATQYARIGLIEDAIGVLKRFVRVVKKKDVMVWYYLGFYLRQLGKSTEGNRYYREAAKMNQEYIFPHRLEAYTVFDDAVKFNRRDDTAWYALGNLLASRRRIDEATHRWEICEKLKSKNSVVYRNLGLVLFRVRNQPLEAIKKYRKAIRLDPDDRELYWELDLVYARLGMDKQRIRLHQSRPKALQLDMKTNARLADAYFNLGEFDNALKVLLSQEFSPWEGGLFFRHLYKWSYLYRAEEQIESGEYEAAMALIDKAEEYPENILVRKPKQPRLSSIQYYRGLVYEKMGNAKKARACWRDATDGVYADWTLAFTTVGFYKAKALKKLGRTAQAETLFKRILNNVRHHEGEESARSFEIQGLIEIETGQLGDAYQSLSRSLELLRSNITVKKALQDIQNYLNK